MAKKTQVQNNNFLDLKYEILALPFQSQTNFSDKKIPDWSKSTVSVTNTRSDLCNLCTTMSSRHEVWKGCCVI